MTAQLEKVLAEVRNIQTCRAMTNVLDGGRFRRCKGKPQRVTLVCEHEHFYEAALCEQHTAEVRTTELGCPHCVAAVQKRHKCRHRVVQS